MIVRPQAGRHVIVTASDDRCGDFLQKHWHKSLVENVDLTSVDVVVLDYGLRREVATALSGAGVIVHPCVKDGHVTNLRYRDMARLLRQSSYDQVLAVDGGDLVFQGDIRPLFESWTTTYRAAVEDHILRAPLSWATRCDIKPLCRKQIDRSVRGRPVINSGFLLGPSRQMSELWASFRKLSQGELHQYGTDQVLVNYLLYRDGFTRLAPTYNYCLGSAATGVRVEHGRVLQRHGQPICVPHNASILPCIRTVADFGYGPGSNRVRPLVYLARRLAFAAVRRAVSRNGLRLEARTACVPRSARSEQGEPT